MRTKINGKVYVTCPECKGNKGKKAVVIGVQIPGTLVKCRACGGRGKVQEAKGGNA